MDKNQEMLLKELMAVSFSAYDLHLYLNTHPYDQKALFLFRQNTQRAQMLKDYYQRLYGPLTASAAAYSYPWQWIKSPWPWEFSANPSEVESNPGWEKK